jgi:hypothetical protein
LNPAPGPLPPDPPQGSQPAAAPPDLRDELERPSLKAALLLLVPAALCSGLFYLWLRKPGEAIAYGCLLGGGAAAIAAEFIKYARSLREHPEEGGGAGKRVLYLALHAFRLGFFKTFWELARELFKLAGFKVVISLVFALAAYLIARAGHWF